MNLSLTDIANNAQRQASDPYISAWVSASAGSGKTKVLTDRVLQLLLAKNEPETILCLTFTKAAAAEMANRLSKTLKDWMLLDDDKLIKELKKLTGQEECDLVEKTDFARTLFAKVLDTKGGMKIMTIHSFCQSILKRFPLEAGVLPSFEVAEDTATKELLNKAIMQTFRNSIFQKQMYILSGYLEQKDLLKLLSDIRSDQLELEHLLDENMSFQSLQEKIYASLEVHPNQTENDLIKTVYEGNDFEEYKLKFLTKKNEIRSNILKEGGEQKEIAQKILTILEKINSLKTAQATCAFLSIAFDVLQNFETLKNKAALLDYTDLIFKTRSLLEEKDMTAWVLYKLDGGIDHILLDEAQDTSPHQWAIIRCICEEFFAGEGRKADKIRTLFAVGDKKQSIYRFQGADANEFEKMRLFFTKRIKDSQNTFKDIPLNISFRSTQAVLDLVNFLLKSETARKGVLRQDEDGTHFAYRKGHSGLVEIWPLEEYHKKEKKDENDWTIDNENDVQQSSVARLSAKIASRIAQMLNNHEMLVSQNRPIQPGDIMILVRSRKRQSIVSELVRALKKENIPLAGVDRLILNQHIAVMDLISLGSFLLLPEDDLSLAEVLKSPIFNITEEELFDLAYDRNGQSLWSQIALKRSDIYETLKKMLSKVDTLPVFELYSYILDALHIREKFLSKMGAETNEMLDEFLNLALNFEKNHISNLEAFLQFLKKEDIEIKRDLDNSEINAVRIMTVHGSKGLQAGIVFLPDTYSKTSKPPKIIWNGNLPIWIPKAELKTKVSERILNKISDEDEDEYNRLLYVALTRAQDRLYICGFETGKKVQDNSWYDMIKTALPQNVSKIEYPQTTDFEKKKEIKKFKTEKIEEPEWFYKELPEEPVPSRPLSPSKLTQKEPEAPSPLTQEQEKAMQKGTFIHKLLQFLPDIEEKQRADFIQKLTPVGMEPPLDLLDLFNTNEMKVLFGNNSIPEIPIIGVNTEGKVISGQIDRLVVTPNEVLIIDFKTNRYPPKNTQDVPLAYVEQMKAYKDLLKNIFSDKKIRCFLLWTTTLTLMELK